ncbi:cytosolic sulfotransferase 15-like [Syzygium oleosum]|uniref:cytosolic sulfotransferase 15-like n=1 Tax=Syzygium oleosum TaxID=219896 RepID=UPI0024BAA703|nr:cytosolic sulfotransferase 15-like [Syzygium oleosum]XP_056175986.1 cytosolic sulfotransferase 15-like [Syzygium oleosum]
MAHQQFSSQSAIVGGEEHDREAIDELIASLPQRKGVVRPFQSLYQNFWCPTYVLPNVIAFQRHFQAKHEDIVLASQPKSGTTWLKALVFSIVNRSRFGISNTPLLTSNPHVLVPSFEFRVYGSNPRPNLDSLVEPRLFQTHIPYPSLPECIKQSDCRIIYICRNPLDAVVSSWHFNLEIAQSNDQLKWSLEEHFEIYCQGKMSFGPFWDQIMGYSKESLERPHKVLFLKYEDLKEDIVGQLKKVAEFVGLPFTEEEEEGGMIEEITKMCSLKTLKDLEVNKSGKLPAKHMKLENRNFFRKGEVGDWVKHLTPSMVDRLNSIMQEKMSPFGLEFKTS